MSSSMLLLLLCCVGLCGMGSTNRWMASAAEAGKQYTLQQVAAEGMGEGGPKFSIDRIKVRASAVLGSVKPLT